MRAMRSAETRPIYEIPADVLDGYLVSFFAGVRQKDGSEYEPDTLTTYQRGIDRYIFVRTTTNFPSAAIKNSQIRVRLWKLNVQN